MAEGDLLYALDGTPERQSADEDRARLEAAAAQARDTASGRREAELAVVRAQLVQARAQAALAQREQDRIVALQAQGFVSTATVDDARTAATQAAGRVAELSAALDAARLPARPEARRVADAQAQAAAAVLAGSQWRLAQTQARSPQSAQVADTYYHEGEWVAAGQPVLSLLPDGRVKARFFVPEAEIASVAPGLAVTLQCDGCGPPIPARVSVIATESEFTPPVIYSNAERARLVFRVEARPSPVDGARLRPGQPLDVRRAP